MTDTPPPSAFDPLVYTRRWLQLGERAHQLTAAYLAHPPTGALATQQSLLTQAMGSWQAIYQGWKQDPDRLLQSGRQLAEQYMTLWQSAAQRWAGGAVAPAAPPVKDKRFASETWQQNAIFDFIKQSYLLTADWARRTVTETPGLDAKTRAKTEFFTRQWVDALSPSNFWMTNPDALRMLAETNGESLLQGFRNLLDDIQRGGGLPQISMTNPHSYALGENIAATPGQVVFRNRLFELIQYTPTTSTVATNPILIIPPWINKYYILDLRPQNSFVAQLVAQGHTVFLISWVNPDASHAEVDFEDYLSEGALAALQTVEAVCGTHQTNVVGYCIGGTLLACLLSYLNAKGEAARVASATYLTAMIDFAEPGDLGVFIDDAQIIALEARMLQQGYLEAPAMATTFNMLRANDLIWSFVVNNYLLGREPLPFDLLFWNADATNLPAAMHSTYLRQMYLHNRLSRPGGISMLQTPLDVTKIATPTFAMAARDDHIAPWHAAYKSAHLYAGPVTFVLAGSGHIAGVINPPAAQKYQHWIHEAREDTPESWLEHAKEFPGSWWPYWHNWLQQYSGGISTAREPGAITHLPLEAAPGSYVRKRAM